MIEAKVTLTQPLRSARQFVARTGGGHSLLIDDKDGLSGPKPIELVAAGLAGCTAFDVIAILRKKRQRVTGYEVRVQADQAAEPPAVFTKVRLHHVVTGFAVDAKAVEDAIHLSEEKYCSVGAMVRRTAEFTTTFEVVQEGAEIGMAVAAR
jgi:putative redox protein